MGRQRDIRLFEQTWRHLAREGLCDAVYGAQFVRVFRAWITRGRPRSIEDYICLDQSSRQKNAPYHCLN